MSIRRTLRLEIKRCFAAVVIAIVAALLDPFVIACVQGRLPKLKRTAVVVITIPVAAATILIVIVLVTIPITIPVPVAGVVIATWIQTVVVSDLVGLTKIGAIQFAVAET